MATILIVRMRCSKYVIFLVFKEKSNCTLKMKPDIDINIWEKQLPLYRKKYHDSNTLFSSHNVE